MNKDFKYEGTIGLSSTHPKDMPEEHSELPVWNSENWFYEDVINHKEHGLCEELFLKERQCNSI